MWHNGVVLVYDDERGLHADYEDWLEGLAPHEPISPYRHNRTGEDNGDAHLKRQVMGREVVVAITDGRLDFGPWEQIFYGEIDCGRRKRMLVKIVREKPSPVPFELLCGPASVPTALEQSRLPPLVRAVADPA